MAGKKKKVQVFECPTESWKERKPRATKNKTKDDEPEMTLRQEIRKEFDDTFDSVLDFATSNLKGKEKKSHEAKKIEALGGKAAKNRSVPYKILIGMKTKGAVKKQRREDLLKESDVVTGKRKASGKSRDQQKRKKVDFGLQATKGRFKGGVLDTVLVALQHRYCVPLSIQIFPLSVRMTEETKTQFTHTDGYVPPRTDPRRFAGSRLIPNREGKGFFSEEEENDAENRDIVTKIHRWNQSTNNKTRSPSKRQELHNLYADPTEKKTAIQTETCTISPPCVQNSHTESDESIRLNRLLDDYMLGEKGDRIMQQMEDLTTDDSPSPEQSSSLLKKTEQEEPSVNFDAMLSMKDFEKYIAEN
ncbi:hypothetical protein P3T76_000579 [Phytophthora citrophthora]|uniref:Uncharacterized protein n=1 Tax=Phytophthora citrophthora TaxID=4793 RepID=A0AAD9H0X5_9STRA|nr:hypothetical protein P3T76_000579 [Phytophthora citrophthora]